jgi:hypothetical protein
MQTKTLSERIEELNKIKKSYEFEPTNNEFFKAMEVIEELEEELQERKAYIVANPCAQCGGRINAMKCDAWAKKAKELEEKLKNNLEETEECCPIETAEAAWNMSDETVSIPPLNWFPTPEHQVKDRQGIKPEPVSIWKDVSELPHPKDRRLDNQDLLLKMGDGKIIYGQGYDRDILPIQNTSYEK